MNIDEGTTCSDMKTLTKKEFKFTVINTNARSLYPKHESLVDCMNKMDAAVTVVTETWFKEGDRMDDYPGFGYGFVFVILCGLDWDGCGTVGV